MAADARTAIAEGNRKFMETFARGDGPGMAALYTRSGQLLPTNSDVVTGHDAIAQFWQGAMEMGIENATLETVELTETDEGAVEVGRYKLTAGDATLDQGKYVVIWQVEDGQWRLHRDIWNSSLPAAQG